MTFKRRWRKRDLPSSERYTLRVSPQLIRSVINDNLDPDVPESLYDFVYEVDDEVLARLGDSILDDQELWLCLTDTIVTYVTSLKFTMMVNEIDKPYNQLQEEENNDY